MELRKKENPMDFKKELNEDRSSNMKGDDYQSDSKEMIFNNATEETADEVKLAGKAKGWYTSKLIADTMGAIGKNNMTAIFAKDKETALDEVLKRIPKNATVSHGGSLTIKELGLIEKLSEGDYHYLRGGIAESKEKEIRRRGFYSDIYITSVNAITKDGRLIAIDGTGNRTAAIMFGPDKVIIIAGKNKIVETLEDGLVRIKEYVAPVHAKRRNHDLPCAVTGKCVNCRSKNRICNKTMIIEYERDSDRMTVILVGEELGI